MKTIKDVKEEIRLLKVEVAENNAEMVKLKKSNKEIRMDIVRNKKHILLLRGGASESQIESLLCDKQTIPIEL